jgi:hypothetical protein
VKLPLTKEQNSSEGVNSQADLSKIDPRIDPLTDKKIAHWVKDKYDKCKQDRQGIANQWYINLAFYKGDQYVQMIRGTLINTPEIPNRVRLKINKIRPAMRTQVSRMTSQKPTATVIPGSSEDEDILAAEAGESVWEHQESTEEYQKRHGGALIPVLVISRQNGTSPISIRKPMLERERMERSSTLPRLLSIFMCPTFLSGILKISLS